MTPGDGPDSSADRAPDKRVDDDPSGVVGWVRWMWNTQNSRVVYVRDVLSPIVVVLLVALVVFAVSGVWPPMVAVTSSSMDPYLRVGDLVFVLEETRLAPPEALANTGIVTYRRGRTTGYTRFNRPGDVIVYEPDGQTGSTQFIHRAMF